MPDGDAFDGAYLRLAATRIARPPAVRTPDPRPRIAAEGAVLWASSGLLPRLTALAPKRRRLKMRRLSQD